MSDSQIWLNGQHEFFQNVYSLKIFKENTHFYLKYHVISDVNLCNYLTGGNIKINK